jgi:D-sedoheptulose 7-phosphate isomerase
MDSQNSLSQIKKIIIDSINLKQSILESHATLQSISKAIDLVESVFEENGKIMLAGNGGSAADAQHIAAEFVGRFQIERPGLAAISLCTDPSIVTGVANDYGYEIVFARQIDALGKPGDLFIGITTSGRSKNILNAIKYSRQRRMKTIVLCGEHADFEDDVDVTIKVPASVTARIQECHIMIGHIICSIVEKQIFKNCE